MAKSVGMTRGAYANLEMARYRILLEHVYKIADACQVDVKGLLPP